MTIKSRTHDTEPICITKVINHYPELKETFFKKEYSPNKAFSFKEIVELLGETRILPCIHYFYEYIPKDTKLKISEYLVSKISNLDKSELTADILKTLQEGDIFNSSIYNIFTLEALLFNKQKNITDKNKFLHDIYQLAVK